jgi:hypothetical protein
VSAALITKSGQLRVGRLLQPSVMDEYSPGLGLKFPSTKLVVLTSFCCFSQTLEANPRMVPH